MNGLRQQVILLIEIMGLRNLLQIKLFVRETWFLSIKLHSTGGQVLLMAKMKLCFKICLVTQINQDFSKMSTRQFCCVVIYMSIYMSHTHTHTHTNT